MVCSLTIVRYPKWMGCAGVLSMAIFRLPLWLDRNIGFWKLMGSGLNGSFDIHPDWRQWAVLSTFTKEPARHPVFLDRWWTFFRCKKWTVLLEPIEGYGTWDGKKCFGELPRETGYEGRIAVLTRASIRLSQLKNFWRNVSLPANRSAVADGMQQSFGIGELPLIKQATFSIWESKEKMKSFAYRMREHTDVIVKTRQQQWYTEEMFVRFKILSEAGSLKD